MSKKFAVIDSETDPFDYSTIPEPFVWGFFDGKIYKEFDKTSDLVAYCMQFDGNIYAHNGGKFDYHFIINFADYEQQILIINGRLSKWKLGKATMLDSYNILPVPLSLMQKDDFDYNKMHYKKRNKFKLEISTYLKHDCEYLHKHIKIFNGKFGQNITLASAAFKFWINLEKRKIDKNFVPPFSDIKYYKKFQPYYFGGRVTAFKKGTFQKKLVSVDINSAYPAVMKKYKHPLYTSFIETKKLPKNDKDIQNCFIQLQCDSYGALPYRTKKGINFHVKKNTIFNTTGFEFLAGLNTNSIKNVKILNVIKFESLYSFEKYVNHFYTLKNNSEKNSADYIFSKLMLNSLYGKFASNPERYEEHILCNYGTRPKLCEIREAKLSQNLPATCEHCEICRKWKISGSEHSFQIMSRKIPEEKYRFYNICTSASITSAVRGYMLESLHKVNTPYYCDTDSILCESYKNLKISQKLGEWSIEGEPVKAAIAGKKLYGLWFQDGSTKVASKGVNFTANDIEKLTQGYCVVNKNKAPTYSLKKETYFIERNITADDFNIKNTEKIFSENYNKFKNNKKKA